MNVQRERAYRGHSMSDVVVHVLRKAKLLAIVALVVLMLAVAACQNTDGPPDTGTPNIEVRDGSGALILAAGVVNFAQGSYFGAHTPESFTINNVGDGTLNLILPLTISGANPTYYTVTVSPAGSVAAGLSTGFTIDFPTDINAAGLTYTADVTIESDDPDQGSFTFGVSGVATS